MTTERPPLGSTKRTATSVRGPASEGTPVAESIEGIRVVGSQIQRAQEAAATSCMAGGEILWSPQDASAVCKCKGLVCKNCIVRCDNETCRVAVCPPCRRRISADNEPAEYLCLECYQEWMRERLLLALAILVLVAGLFLGLFLWLR